MVDEVQAKKLKIGIGIASKDKSFRTSAEDFEAFNKDSTVAEIVPYFWESNKNGLPRIYNEYLNVARQKKELDAVIFMHADVQLDMKHLIAHFIECKDKYDVMGLCGCKKFSVGQSPLNWFTGSSPFPQDRWGCVTHGELGDQRSFFSEDRSDITDSEVACIDGLCIIFTKKALYSSFLFDERFLFDQYDTDCSAQCLLRQHFKLGVLVETSLQHFSIGKSILTQEFLVHENDLRAKWNWPILPKVQPSQCST